MRLNQLLGTSGDAIGLLLENEQRLRQMVNLLNRTDGEAKITARLKTELPANKRKIMAVKAETLAEKVVTYIKAFDPAPAGTYTEWLVSRWLNGAYALEDLPGIMEQLRIFNNKRPLLPGEARDIGRYKTPGDVVEVIRRFMKPVDEGLPEFFKGKEDEIERNHSDILRDDASFLIVHPKDKLAAQYWGWHTGEGNQPWCVTWGIPGTKWATHSNQFASYTRDDQHFIFVFDKRGHPHFRSGPAYAIRMTPQRPVLTLKKNGPEEPAMPYLTGVLAPAVTGRFAEMLHSRYPWLRSDYWQEVFADKMDQAIPVPGTSMALLPQPDDPRAAEGLAQALGVAPFGNLVATMAATYWTLVDHQGENWRNLGVFLIDENGDLKTFFGANIPMQRLQAVLNALGRPLGREAEIARKLADRGIVHGNGRYTSLAETGKKLFTDDDLTIWRAGDAIYNEIGSKVDVIATITGNRIAFTVAIPPDEARLAARICEMTRTVPDREDEVKLLAGGYVSNGKRVALPEEIGTSIQKDTDAELFKLSDTRFVISFEIPHVRSALLFIVENKSIRAYAPNGNVPAHIVAPLIRRLVQENPGRASIQWNLKGKSLEKFVPDELGIFVRPGKPMAATTDAFVQAIGDTPLAALCLGGEKEMKRIKQVASELIETPEHQKMLLDAMRPTDQWFKIEETGSTRIIDIDVPGMTLYLPALPFELCRQMHGQAPIFTDEKVKRIAAAILEKGVQRAIAALKNIKYAKLTIPLPLYLIAGGRSKRAQHQDAVMVPSLLKLEDEMQRIYDDLTAYVENQRTNRTNDARSMMAQLNAQRRLNRF